MTEPEIPPTRPVSFVALPVQQLSDLRQKLNAVCADFHAFRCGTTIAASEHEPIRQCVEDAMRSLSILDGLIKNRRDESNGGAP